MSNPKTKEYAGKNLGQTPVVKRDEKNNGLPGDVVHISTLSSAEDWSEVKNNISGVTPTQDCQMEGSTGKRVYTEGSKGSKSGKTEGYSVMQPASHQGETNADGSNPMSPNRKK